MKILVMAQGEASRWNESMSRRIVLHGNVPEYKQLLQVGTETLLGRTLRLIKEFGINPDDIAVVAPKSFKGYTSGVRLHTLDSPGKLLNGIAECEGFLLGERATIVLGDVLFSHDSLGELLDSSGVFTFLGRIGSNPSTGKNASELFGFAMASDVYEQAMSTCRFLTRRGSGSSGKLWVLHSTLTEKQPDSVEFIQTYDWTDDIDSVEEYQQFWPQLLRMALLERKGGPLDPRGT
jgi:hypothetical protein